uniref:Uncharacterized protein n=1 Tax=Arundo donax TaxID=35708 RepID=A0A0A8ZE69_ARUDO
MSCRHPSAVQLGSFFRRECQEQLSQRTRRTPSGHQLRCHQWTRRTMSGHQLRCRPQRLGRPPWLHRPSLVVFRSSCLQYRLINCCFGMSVA